MRKNWLTLNIRAILSPLRIGTGACFDTGFFIQKKLLKIYSKNFCNENKKFPSWLIKLIFCFFVSLNFFTFLYLELQLNPWQPLKALILIIPSLCISSCCTILLFLFLFPAYYSRDLREYHACEHMTALLLGSGLPLTMENLKSMPRVHIICGTAQLIFISFCLVAITGIFLNFPIFWFFIFHFFMVWLIQNFFATTPPSEEKLAEALEVAKEFADKYHRYGPYL